MSIEINKITKYFGTQKALNEVSFKVKTGEIVGFLGPNGAGKSTLMKILTGFISADEGEARIEGLMVEPEKTDFKKRIGYLPEHNPLYTEMYIKEYLELVAGFYKIKHKKKRIAEVIEMTGLQPEISKKIGALSKGYRQRVGIAQALIHDPSVLILDEPTSGLDPNQLDDIRKLIKDISKEKTVILSTHIMQEVEAICNRIIILNKGDVVADTVPEEIRKLSEAKNQHILFATKNHISKESFIQLPYIAGVEQLKSNEFLIDSAVEYDIRPNLFDLAVENKWTILTLFEKEKSVENIFRELTNEPKFQP